MDLGKLETLTFLYVAFQFKHFLADYPLRTPYMLRKSELSWSFFLPLLTHALVHGAFTLGICLFLNSALWWLALIDVGSHFVMDRIKASPRYLGRFTMKQPFLHWTTFGGDQLFHHLVGIYMFLETHPVGASVFYSF